jgi:serine/threonine protein kinase
MPNGSLDMYTFGNNPSEVYKILSWKTLFDIIIKTARRLDYLDVGCKTRIVHFDIKPHNILLDQTSVPKSPIWVSEALPAKR